MTDEEQLLAELIKPLNDVERLRLAAALGPDKDDGWILEEAADELENLRAELAIRDGYLRRISRYVGANPDTLMWKEEALKIVEGKAYD